MKVNDLFLILKFDLFSVGFVFLIDITQQILDAQSAQNVTNNNDNGTDSGIQRSRSSITRTLLMNAGIENLSITIIFFVFVHFKNEIIIIIIIIINRRQSPKDHHHHQNFQKILNI
jgi:hypothetical protein